MAPGEKKKEVDSRTQKKKKKKKSIPFLFSQSNPKGRLSLDNLQQHTAEQVKREAQVSGTVGLKGK